LPASSNGSFGCHFSFYASRLKACNLSLIASLSLSTLFIGALPLSWLVSNHYPPWISAWADGAALAPLLGAAAFLRQASALPKTWCAAIALALASMATQAALKPDVFGGDLWMAMLYVCALASAIALGVAAQSHGLSKQTNVREDTLAPLAIGLVVAGIASVGLASVQWLDVRFSSLYVIAVPPGGRPFGNFAQPNNFCTGSFLALAALTLLRQWGRIGALGYWLGALWLASGMVMSGSRTGWLQMAVLLLATAVQARRMPLRPGLRGVVGLTIFYVALTAAWPSINELLAQKPVRSLEAQMQGGSRQLHWQVLLDAIAHEPLTGYGWGRVGAAQIRAAADHAAPFSVLEHSHNLLLDLVVWAGVPVGGAIALLLGSWFFTRMRAYTSPTAHGWMVALAGLLVHAMLEYPLEYAYFLLPAGLMIGAVESLHPRSGAWPLRPWVLRAASLGLLALLAVVSLDYLRAEEGYRTMRFETARIGTNQTTPPPQLLLLSQLQAYQQFVQTPAKPDMSAEQMTTMRRVSERYPFPPVMLRYALATGLNGDPTAASRTLISLCRMHAWERCAEAREAWQALQTQFPQLAAVPVPAMQLTPSTP
jgi:O-antigen ligase